MVAFYQTEILFIFILHFLSQISHMFVQVSSVFFLT